VKDHLKGPIVETVVFVLIYRTARHDEYTRNARFRRDSWGSSDLDCLGVRRGPESTNAEHRLVAEPRFVRDSCGAVIAYL
jgi:hypothetical protein